MRTADSVSNIVTVVDNSIHVNGESRFSTQIRHVNDTCSQAAMGRSTGDLSEPFAVTLADGTLAVMPAPPLIIPAGSIMGIPGDFATDITPEGMLQ